MPRTADPAGSIARVTKSSRTAGAEALEPEAGVDGVAGDDDAPSSKPSWVRTQSALLGDEPSGGPGTVQPPRSVSNEVDATGGAVRGDPHVVDEHAEALGRPVGDVRDGQLDLLAGVRATGRRPTRSSRWTTRWPRSTSPVVPVEAQSGPRPRSGRGTGAARRPSPRRSSSPAVVSVCPLASGSVVQSSVPTSWASTNMKSQSASVS